MSFVFFKQKTAYEVRISDWSSDVCSSDLVVDTNLKGAWLMARAVAEHMTRLGHAGSIINMASVLGLAGAAQIPAYCASKGGLVNLTRALAVEWAREGIRVNAIEIGRAPCRARVCQYV